MGRVVIHRGAPFRKVLDQWADKDGRQRAERVASSMRSGAPSNAPSGYASGIGVMADRHPTRVSFHIGSTDRSAPRIEANSGNAIRALDSAR